MFSLSSNIHIDLEKRGEIFNFNIILKVFEESRLA